MQKYCLWKCPWNFRNRYLCGLSNLTLKLSKEIMKILAFAGSSSKESINLQLVKYVAAKLEGHEIEILDLNDYEMPIYSIDREKDGIPEQAQRFAQKIDAADFLLISLAEHNSTYTTAFKNIFDWISRIKDRKAFGEKNMFLMSTATGPGGGKNVMQAAVNRMPFSGGTVVETFMLPRFKDNFNAADGITDPEKASELEHKITGLKKDYLQN